MKFSAVEVNTINYVPYVHCTIVLPKVQTKTGKALARLGEISAHGKTALEYRGGPVCKSWARIRLGLPSHLSPVKTSAFPARQSVGQAVGTVLFLIRHPCGHALNSGPRCSYLHAPYPPSLRIFACITFLKGIQSYRRRTRIRTNCKVVFVT
jgi:hypothetical protein